MLRNNGKIDRPGIKLAVKRNLQGRLMKAFFACIIPSALSFVLRLFPASSGVIYFLFADIIVGISLPMTVVSFIAATLVTEPMAVRVAGYFLHLNRKPDDMPSPLTVCDCFGPGYMRLVGGMLLREVFASACLIVPIGIGLLLPGAVTIVEVEVGSAIMPSDTLIWCAAAGMLLRMVCELALFMVPYLLADDPWLPPMKAIQRSLHMTSGRKWELFVLELSFLGWVIASAFTLMLAGIYAAPYAQGVYAGYYLALLPPPRDEEADALHAA